MNHKDRAERKDADSKAYQRRMTPLAKRMEKSRKGASERLVSRWDALLSDLGYTAGMSREAAGAWLLQGVPPKVKRNIRRMSLLAPKVTHEVEESLDGTYTVRKAIHDVGRIETSRSTETLRDDVREPLEDTAKEAHARTEFGIQKELGFGMRFEPFEDGVYTRIANRQASYTRMHSYLARTMTEPMERALVDGVRDGLGVAQIERNMRKVSDDVPPYISKMVARTMITETATDSEAEALEDSGVDTYIFLAGLDERTCDVCGMLDGKKFKLSEREAGVNCPPMHLNCRCTITAVPDPDFAKNAKRSAKDKDGNWIRVPKSMDYAKWRESIGKPYTPPEKVPERKKPVEIPNDTPKKEKPVKTGGEPKERPVVTAEKYPSVFNDTKTKQKSMEEFVKVVNAQENADPAVLNLYANLDKLDNISPDIGDRFTTQFGSNCQVSYRYSGDKLYGLKVVTPKLDGKYTKSRVGTTLHEQMHMIDHMADRKENPHSYELYSREFKPLNEFFEKTTEPTMSKEVEDMFTEFNKQHDELKERLTAERNAKHLELNAKYKAGELTYKEYNKAFDKVTKEYAERIEGESRELMGGGITTLQDIYDAMSGGKWRDKTRQVRYGHGVSYYRRKGNKEAETVANYAALSVMRPDLVELLDRDYPELTSALRSYIQSVTDMLS